MIPDHALDHALRYLRNYPRSVKIMEVCGSHTASIVKSGLRGLLSGRIRLVSGPGCPVCVTPGSYIDALIGASMAPDTCVLSFGDLFRVTGRHGSFSGAKANGGAFRVIYSPMEAAALAAKSPETAFVVAAVGFETTAPLYAVLLERLIAEKLPNVRLAAALKTMPPALSYLCKSEAVDGFLCPGHVSAVIGAGAYAPLWERYQKPFVITGFEPEQILLAVCRILRQLDEGRPRVENLYPSAVTETGNQTAQELMARYFKAAEGDWRGIGRIAGSALVLREEYARFGMKQTEDDGGENVLCRCCDVMLGRIFPSECELFGTACTPDNPVGACMASGEGACGIDYNGGGA